MGGKIQGADVKTEAELVTAGATKTSLIRDTQIYVTGNSINKTLDDAIIDGDIGGGGAAPAGSVIDFAGSSAPTGWLICDGSVISRTTYAALFTAIGTTWGVGDGSTTFGIPDARGVFIRGVGVNATLLDANGTGFTGTLGTYQNDKMQGHFHTPSNALRDSTARYPTDSGGTFAFGRSDLQGIGSPSADGSNGTPRTGVETNPANIAMNKIIKT